MSPNVGMTNNEIFTHKDNIDKNGEFKTIDISLNHMRISIANYHKKLKLRKNTFMLPGPMSIRSSNKETP